MESAQDKIRSWHDLQQKSYEGQYMEHLALLHEWNEMVSFYPTLTTITMGQLGVVVYQEVQQRNAVFHQNGELSHLEHPTLFQLVAVYGDEDELKRLIIIDNGRERVPDPETWVPYPPVDDSWREFAAEGHTHELIGKIIRK